MVQSAHPGALGFARIVPTMRASSRRIDRSPRPLRGCLVFARYGLWLDRTLRRVERMQLARGVRSANGTSVRRTSAET